jgi:hypothetical protein
MICDLSFFLDFFLKISFVAISNRRYQAETTRLLDEKYRLHVKAYTDESKKEEKVGHAVVLPEITINRKQLPQTSIHSVEQSAIKMQTRDSDHH